MGKGYLVKDANSLGEVIMRGRIGNEKANIKKVHNF